MSPQVAAGGGAFGGAPSGNAAGPPSGVRGAVLCVSGEEDRGSPQPNVAIAPANRSTGPKDRRGVVRIGSPGSAARRGARRQGTRRTDHRPARDAETLEHSEELSGVPRPEGR